MFAGASPTYWIAFGCLVAVLLFIDLALLHRGSRSVSIRAAWAWTAVLAGLAFCFALFLSQTQGKQRGLEFLSGYLVEGSLSIDNLFVFLLMFRSLRLDIEQQHRVLLWGVLGAIVMRAVFIFVGASLLAHFLWVEYIFGAIILFAAIRLVRHQSEMDEPSGPIRWLMKRAGSGNARMGMSSFLLIVLAVEATDLVFALDSVPAVLAITRDTFIVYTSNIFAILGLRSLYFALSHALDRLRLLHYGLALILAFVGIKMILSQWVEIPIGWSLGFIVGVLIIFTVLSRFTAPKQAEEPSES
ncbi:MAG: TerC/Alx family metal homeostasis membrane protein [Acidobacteriaceae bacterium]